MIESKHEMKSFVYFTWHMAISSTNTFQEANKLSMIQHIPVNKHISFTDTFRR